MPIKFRYLCRTTLDTVAAEVGRLIQTPEARSTLAAQGIESTGFAQRQFQQQVAAEYERYARIVKLVGIKAEEAGAP